MSNLPKPLIKYGHVTSSWLPIPKIFIFRLILYQVFGKVTKFGGNWLKKKKVTGKKQIGKWNPPPSAYKVNINDSLKMWNFKELNFEGKIQIFKSLALSKAVYVCTMTSPSIFRPIKSAEKGIHLGWKVRQN